MVSLKMLLTFKRCVLFLHHADWPESKAISADHGAVEAAPQELATLLLPLSSSLCYRCWILTVLWLLGSAWVVRCLCLHCSWFHVVILVGAVHVFWTPYITTLLFPHARLFMLDKTTTAFVVGKRVGWTCNDVGSDGPKPCEGSSARSLASPTSTYHLEPESILFESWIIQDKLRVSSTIRSMTSNHRSLKLL